VNLMVFFRFWGVLRIWVFCGVFVVYVVLRGLMCSGGFRDVWVGVI